MISNRLFLEKETIFQFYNFKVFKCGQIKGVWTIGRKTISRQRTIGRGGQSVAEGQSVAKDNRPLKDDRSQTIGRRVKILNLHILMANSEYKKIETEIRNKVFGIFPR